MSILVETNKSFQYATRAAVIDQDDRVRAWAERYVRKDRNLSWLTANFVEADNPNGNGHIFKLEDLKASQHTIPFKPLNWLHHGRYVVGSVVGAELQIPESEINHLGMAAASQNPFIEILAGMWRHEFPEEASLLQKAHKEGSLFVSMECQPEEVTCPSCNMTAAFDGPTSDSYCMPPGTFISMGDGTRKKIEHIQVGDKVVTREGTSTVSQLFKRDFEGELVAIWRKNLSEPLYLTGNHPVLVEREGSWIWSDAKDVSVEDRLQLAICNETKDFNIDLHSLRPELTIKDDRVRLVSSNGSHDTMAKFDFPRIIKATPALACIVGHYLAQGSLAQPSQSDGEPMLIEWCFAGDSYGPDELQAALDKFGAGVLCRYPAADGKKITVKLSNAPLASLLKFLAGSGAKNKELSFHLMRMDTVCQKELLRTYGDDDGWDDPRSGFVEARTASTNLAYQLVTLNARVHGSVPNVFLNSKVPGGPSNRKKLSKIWYVSLGSRWRSPVVALGNHRFSASVKRVSSVEYAGPVYNFAVEGVENYVANDVVVHNCSHMAGPIGPKILDRPHFMAAAVIVPPIRPGWSGADVTQMAELIKDRTEEAEKVYAQIQEEAPHLDKRTWEHLMTQVLLTAKHVPTEKRKNLEKQGNALPGGRYPIADVGDLKAAIQSFGRAKPSERAEVKAHIKKRAKQLGRMDLIPEGW